MDIFEETYNLTDQGICNNKQSASDSLPPARCVSGPADRGQQKSQYAINISLVQHDLRTKAQVRDVGSTHVPC